MTLDYAPERQAAPTVIADVMQRLGVRMSFAKGEEIFGQDEEADLIHMVVRGAARTTRFSARAPARWPAPTGRCRSLAQRPLPSMMIATCRGDPVLSGSPVCGVSPFNIGFLQTVRISFSLVASSLSMSAMAASVTFWISPDARS